VPIEPERDAHARDGLTDFQIEVARLFFALPASAGFLLAGGAALLAQHLISRPTQDLDFFTSQNMGEVDAARAALETASAARGWKVRPIRDTPTFVRLVIVGPEDLIVDIARDSPPGRPPSVSIAGPTFDPEELAGRKIALFDRAEPATSPTCTPLLLATTRRCCSSARPRSMPASIVPSSPTCCAPSPGSPTRRYQSHPER
jgi:hypothetical protein